MALSKTTQDHEEIRQWAEARGGKPAEVTSTSADGTGILRIEFPGAPGAQDSNLNEISWEEFFEKFDASGLSLVYQEVTAEGAESNFNKLIHAEAPTSKPAKKATAKKSGTKSATPAKKASAKTVPAKRSSAKSAPASGNGRKSAAKKSSATKKAAAKTAPARAGKGAAPKKNSVKKAAAKKAPAKKATAKKTTSRKAAAKKTSYKKAATRPSSTKKISTKKASAKKTTKAGAQRAAIAIKKKSTPKKGR